MAACVNKKRYFRSLPFLKKLFWVYFLLLIFEGALRKWVAPQLSGPLLIIRDPVGLWIIWEAYRTKKWPQRWTAAMGILTVLLVGLLMVQIVITGNPLVVGLFGLRSYLLPFPVLFIMGENIDREDLRKLGRCVLWILPPMSVLEVLQYETSPSSFWNKGAYAGAEQIGYVGAHVRAAGTFSFNVGSAAYVVLAAAFVVYAIFKEGFAPKWLVMAGAFSVVLSLPMVGSRGVVFQLAAMVGCVGLGGVMGISQFAKVFRLVVAVVIASFLVSLLPVFSDATASLTDRFAGASQGEEGGPLHSVYFRLVEPVVEKFESSDFWANTTGIGMGRSAIAVQAFLTGERTAIAGEGDFERIIAEMGPLPGLTYELFRLFLAVWVFGQALGRARDQEPLALLLVPLVVPNLLIATFEQTTEQGFVIVGLALMIAASKARQDSAEPELLESLYQRNAILRQRLSASQFRLAANKSGGEAWKTNGRTTKPR